MNNTWDIIVLMLGTNDAKDKIDGGPSNWGCGIGPNVTVDSCQFAQDYLDFLSILKTLGPGGKSPIIYVMRPAPLMEHGSIGANQTVINTVYPALIPAIVSNRKTTTALCASQPNLTRNLVNVRRVPTQAKASGLTTTPIDIFGAMGGVADWETEFPKQCTLNSNWKPCALFCDSQSCDQCQ